MKHNRKYIGARYVPLVMGEWSSATAYEPLSIVLHEGNSYTSRQYVPVGIEIDDDRYWVGSGMYNAQFEQLSQLVSTYEHRISTLEDNGKILLIGDSYSSHSVSSDWEATWPESLASYMGMGLTNLAIPGAAFHRNANITAQVTQALALDDKDDYKTVIVYAGVNDARANVDVTSFQTAVQSVLSSLSTAFPHADCILVGPQCGKETFETDADFSNYANAMKTATRASRNRFSYIDGRRLLLYNNNPYETDGLHPSVGNGNQVLLYTFKQIVNHAPDVGFFTYGTFTPSTATLAPVFPNSIKSCMGQMIFHSRYFSIAPENNLPAVSSLGTINSTVNQMTGKMISLNGTVLDPTNTPTHFTITIGGTGAVTLIAESGFSAGTNYRFLLPGYVMDVY